MISVAAQALGLYECGFGMREMLVKDGMLFLEVSAELHAASRFQPHATAAR